jgi:hypothetical protein
MATLLLLVSTATVASAQYVPPSPAAPVAGVIDDNIKAIPELAGWDFGINERFRSENKSDAGTTHAGSNYDFFSASPTDNSNDYWLNVLCGGPLQLLFRRQPLHSNCCRKESG